MTQQEREAYARIGTRAAELMVRYPERSVDYCLYIACLEDVVAHARPQDPQHTLIGTPTWAPPIRILES